MTQVYMGLTQTLLKRLPAKIRKEHPLFPFFVLFFFFVFVQNVLCIIKILDEVKQITHHSMMEILKMIDPDFLKETIDYPQFRELFFASSKDEAMNAYLKKFLA